MRKLASRSPSASPLACLVLAAGKGTRMRSTRAKVLHAVLGTPLLCYPIDRARALRANPVVAVLGHQLEAIGQMLDHRYGPGSIAIAEQKEQRGTGDAVRIGLRALGDFSGVVVILYGDTPLLTERTLRALVAAARRTNGLAMLTARVPNPAGYGRVIRDPKGRVQRVTEDKDATPAERAIDEINAGMYAAPAAFLRQATARLSPRNAQGEFYLTDIVEQAARADAKAPGGVAAIRTDPEEIAGINDRGQLAQAEAVMQQRVLSRHTAVASFRDPASVTIEADVVIEPDVEIGRGVTLRGRTRIRAGARIAEGCILTNTDVGPDTEIKAYSIAEDARIGPACKIGPFAHLRPGTELGAQVHLGNFVETKKARLGNGSKANHLSYLGDAVIGEKVNVGAGTITCNYNGFEKRVTTIEDGAFIGSDSQLIAPVTIGKGAVIGAGATVTKDVPAGALALSRSPETHVEGYAARLAARYAQTRNAAPAKSVRPQKPRPSR